jgi:uncharacterized membrane protein
MRKKPNCNSGFTIKMSLKLGIIICVAAILSLVVPAAADNSTATVHGVLYSLDTFEPLDNAVVYVNSIPAQSFVAKYGMYSFELEPGNYTITANYYQNSTVTYSVDETVNIKNKGNYVLDLLLLPVYSEALMDSSKVNVSSKNSTSSAENPAAEVAISKITNSKGVNATEDSGFYTPTVSYLLIALTLVFLLAAGFQLSRKRKKIGKTSREEKTGHTTRDFSRPVNTPELSVKVTDKSIGPELRKNFQVNREESVSITGQVTEPEPKISITEPVMESKSKEENRKTSLEKPAANPEIETPYPKKKLPLTADLQEIMDIIRGQRGRITQKDLCSRLKCSDAKVSLMLADLEKRELIEKVKQGRGNVVTLRDEKR